MRIATVREIIEKSKRSHTELRMKIKESLTKINSVVVLGHKR